MDSTKSGGTAVDQVTHLLCAHGDLMRSTSEACVANIARAVEQLQVEVSEALDGQDCQGAILDRVSGIYAQLQLEDILRQQVLVLQAGLKALAQLQPPPGLSAEAWREETLKTIMESYAMRSQHELHAALTGGDLEGFEGDRDNAVLF
ncbi:MAG: hypothetical protein AAGL23_05840 [Pseudomonadota bacterium]